MTSSGLQQGRDLKNRVAQGTTGALRVFRTAHQTFLFTYKGIA